MTGSIFAILAALSFAVGGIVTRRAVLKVVNAAAGVLITVPLGILFFLLILIITGQTSSIVSFSWQSYAWLSAAGIIHFVVGRSLSYSCVQLVGQNMANIFFRASPLVAVFLGISVLGESVTWQLIVGVLLIVGGIILTGLSPLILSSGHHLFSNIPRKAILLGVGSGLSWGISPIMVKIGLAGSGIPAAGAFISCLAATIVLSFFMLKPNTRVDFKAITKGPLGLFLIMGLLVNTSQLLRYTALGMAPASVVSPLFSTTPIFQLLLAFLFNRKLEVFNKPIILGTIAVVIGSILLVGAINPFPAN
jgi:drug/metabolite transporter (DMT)-like permease